MTETRSKYFYCYSVRLKSFLKAFGVEYITKGINPHTNTMYFMFERSDKLNAILSFWGTCKTNFDNYPDSGDVVVEDGVKNGGEN